MATFRPKENARPEFLLMVMESWTYNRMTVDEKSTCLDKIITATIKGRFLQRWAQLQAVFSAYLDSIGYSGAGWRDAQNAPTEEETSTTGQDTACTDEEPQEGTETAQKTADMETFKKAYSAAYSHLYDHCGEPETDERERYYCGLFCDRFEEIAQTVRKFSEYRHDLVSSDREAAAFMIALEAVGAPTDGETATDGETTTTSETKPQRATETPRKAIQTGERLYSHPHRHMVIVEGMQGDLVRVIYKGRLYLVCSSDLYTDETETTPAMLPQATESAGTTAGDTTPTAGDTEPQRATERTAAAESVSQSDRRTRPAAPQSHGTTKGIQRHHRPPKTAYRAIQRAAADTTPPRAGPRNVLFLPGCTKPDQIHRKFRGTPFLIGFPARTLSGIFGGYI